MIVCFCLSVVFISKLALAEVELGENYFTTANIWYENPDRMSSLNYHVGKILPLGTKVEVVYVADRKIIFIDKNEVQYTLFHDVKRSTIPLEELFERYFSKKKQATMFLDGKAKKAIKTGKLIRKIKREEALMAYGYPPSHVTKDLSADVWTYWGSRSKKEIVHFVKDRISFIER